MPTWQSSITALARVNGYPVGVMIKNPMSPSGGAMDTVAGEKMVRFLQLCDTFHLPMVNFVDELGFVVGLDSEKQGIVRTAARVLQAIYQTKMPCISFKTSLKMLDFLQHKTQEKSEHKKKTP